MQPAKVIFLDRDGVINKYPGDFKYVVSPDDLHLLDNSKEALEKLCAGGYHLFIISNQAGVSKGLYSQDILEQITKKMLSLLGDKIRFDEIYYCTHLSDARCQCRKPKTAFIDSARDLLLSRGLTIDYSGSYFIGDSVLDIQTGIAAGLKTILVFSGREKPDNKPSWNSVPDFTAVDLNDAVDNIVLVL